MFIFTFLIHLCLNKYFLNVVAAELPDTTNIRRINNDALFVQSSSVNNNKFHVSIVCTGLGGRDYIQYIDSGVCVFRSAPIGKLIPSNVLSCHHVQYNVLQ